MRRVLAAAVLTFAVGCGSGGSGDGVATLAGGDGATPSPSASADPADAFRQYAKCMRANGVDVPDPGKPGEGAIVIAPSAAPRRMQAAEKECAPLLKGAIGDAPPPNDPAMQDRALKFARCMREHGIDLPDPGADGAIRKRVGDAGDAVEMPFDPEDPKFAKAHEACGHLFGNGVMPGTVEVRP